MNCISNKQQEIWAAYEILKEDWTGQVTSDQIWTFLGKRYHKSPDTIRKIVENVRKHGTQKYYPSVNQPMTKAEAAEYLGVSVSTIDRLRKSGELKSQSADGKITNGRSKSGKVFFKKEWLDAHKH